MQRRLLSGVLPSNYCSAVTFSLLSGPAQSGRDPKHHPEIHLRCFKAIALLWLDGGWSPLVNWEVSIKIQKQSCFQPADGTLCSMSNCACPPLVDLYVIC